jgi:hypothetical protein
VHTAAGPLSHNGISATCASSAGAGSSRWAVAAGPATRRLKGATCVHHSGSRLAFAFRVRKLQHRGGRHGAAFEHVCLPLCRQVPCEHEGNIPIRQPQHQPVVIELAVQRERPAGCSACRRAPSLNVIMFPAESAACSRNVPQQRGPVFVEAGLTAGEQDTRRVARRNRRERAKAGGIGLAAASTSREAVWKGTRSPMAVSRRAGRWPPSSRMCAPPGCAPAQRFHLRRSGTRCAACRPGHPQPPRRSGSAQAPQPCSR